MTVTALHCSPSDLQEPGTRSVDDASAESVTYFQTRHGRDLLIRPVQPEDSTALVAMFGELSARSTGLRYNTPPRILPDHLVARETARLTGGIDNLIVYVAMESDGSRAIAVAELACDRAEPATAESAMVVVDSYQGEGVGRAIVKHMAAAAAQVSISRIRAFTSAHNYVVQRLVTGSGRPYTTRFDGGDIRYEVVL